MADYEQDEVPMLSVSRPVPDANVDSRFQMPVTRTRSVSISIPMHNMESYAADANLVGYTGPLRNERRTPIVQMSGPLLINRKPENLFRATQHSTAIKTVERKAETFPSFKRRGEDDLDDDSYAGKNEHLLRSGPLGMCNNPYCTTCPTFYNVMQHQQKIQELLVYLISSFIMLSMGMPKDGAGDLFLFWTDMFLEL